MNYLFLFTYNRDQLLAFNAHVTDNINRGWLPKMHGLWNEGKELAERLLNE